MNSRVFNIFFLTEIGKDFYKQLTHKKEVSIIGINKEYQTVRIFGKIKKIDKKWVDRVFEENPVMNNIYPGDSRYILDAFCLYEGEGEFFDLSKEPIFRETFSVGKEKKVDRGFFITENCIGCSTCERICPQKCISNGQTFFINQENCLHCGLCFEECPVNAIEKRNN